MEYFSADDFLQRIGANTTSHGGLNVHFSSGGPQVRHKFRGYETCNGRQAGMSVRCIAPGQPGFGSFARTAGVALAFPREGKEALCKGSLHYQRAAAQHPQIFKIGHGDDTSQWDVTGFRLQLYNSLEPGTWFRVRGSAAGLNQQRGYRHAVSCCRRHTVHIACPLAIHQRLAPIPFRFGIPTHPPTELVHNSLRPWRPQAAGTGFRCIGLRPVWLPGHRI